MKKNKLFQLAFLGLSSSLLFSCQAQGDSPVKKGSEEMNRFINSLPPEQKQKFAQMTDEQKEQAMKAVLAAKQKFYDSLSPELKQKFDSMTEEEKEQAFQSMREAMKRYYDSLTPEQRQKFDDMTDQQKIEALQSGMEKLKNSMPNSNRMPARSPTVN